MGRRVTLRLAVSRVITYLPSRGRCRGASAISVSRALSTSPDTQTVHSGVQPVIAGGRSSCRLLRSRGRRREVVPAIGPAVSHHAMRGCRMIGHRRRRARLPERCCALRRRSATAASVRSNGFATTRPSCSDSAATVSPSMSASNTCPSSAGASSNAARSRTTSPSSAGRVALRRRTVLCSVVASVGLLVQCQRSGVADAGPRREQKQDASVRVGAYGVALIGGELHH